MGAKTIGAKIVLDGEKEYKQALKSVAAQQKELRSEMELAKAEFDGQQGSIEALTKKHEILEKQIEAQQEKVELYSDRLEKAKQVQEDAADSVDKYANELDSAKAELERMTESGTASSEAIEEQKKHIAELEEELSKSEQKYQSASDEVTKWQTSVNNAQTDLVKLNNDLKKNDEYLDEAKNSTDGFAKSLDEVGEESKGLGNIFADMGGKLTAAVGAAAVAGVAELANKMKDLALQTSFYADTLNTMSAQTGISTDTLQKLYYVEELLDVSVQTVTGAMTKNIKSMSQVQQGSKNYVEAYDRIGISVEDANGHLRDSEEVFWEVIDALGAMSNEAERDAVAMQIFGKGAQSLKTLINAGSEGFKEMSAEAERLGYVLSDDTLKSLNELSDSSERVSKKFDALKNNIGAALAPAVTNLYNNFNSLLSVVMGVDTASKSLAKSMEQSQKSYDEHNKAIDTNAARAKVLADRLKELSSNSARTASEQAEMEGTVRALNELYPDLALSINKATGELEGSTESIYKNIDAMVEQARAAAEMERIQDIINQLVQAEMALADAQVNLTDKTDEYNAALKSFDEAADIANKDLSIGTENLGYYNEATQLAKDGMDAAQKEVGTLTEQIDSLNSELEQYSSTQEEANQKTEDAEQAAYDTRRFIEELESEYVKVKAIAYESIKSQVGLFEEFKQASVKSLEEITANLDSQTSAFTDYATDLTTAANTWGKENHDLLESIKSMGMDGAGYIKELNDAYANSTETFDKVVESFHSMEDARDALAEIMADIQTGYSDVIEGMVSSSEDFAGVMVENTEQMAKDMTSAIDEEAPQTVTSLEDMYTELELTANNKMENKDGVSGVYYGLGAMIPDSMKVGVEEHKSNLFKAVEDMFDELTSIMMKKLKEAIAKADRAIGKAAG